MMDRQTDRPSQGNGSVGKVLTAKPGNLNSIPWDPHDKSKEPIGYPLTFTCVLWHVHAQVYVHVCA